MSEVTEPKLAILRWGPALEKSVTRLIHIGPGSGSILSNRANMLGNPKMTTYFRWKNTPETRGVFLDCLSSVSRDIVTWEGIAGIGNISVTTTKGESCYEAAACQLHSWIFLPANVIDSFYLKKLFHNCRGGFTPNLGWSDRRTFIAEKWVIFAVEWPVAACLWSSQCFTPPRKVCYQFFDSE